MFSLQKLDFTLNILLAAFAGLMIILLSIDALSSFLQPENYQYLYHDFDLKPKGSDGNVGDSLKMMIFLGLFFFIGMKKLNEKTRFWKISYYSFLAIFIVLAINYRVII
jgi:hypothetical protein